MGNDKEVKNFNNMVMDQHIVDETQFDKMKPKFNVKQPVTYRDTDAD